MPRRAGWRPGTFVDVVVDDDDVVVVVVDDDDVVVVVLQQKLSCRLQHNATIINSCATQREATRHTAGKNTHGGAHTHTQAGHACCAAAN